MSSIKPSKQRVQLYQAPLHHKVGKVKVHLAKGLRKQVGRRAIGIRKGDTVKVKRGNNVHKSGKVSEVNTRKGFIFVEGITRKKSDGTEIGIPFRPANIEITQLESKDGRRFKRGKKPLEKSIPKGKPAGGKGKSSKASRSKKEANTTQKEAT